MDDSFDLLFAYQGIRIAAEYLSRAYGGDCFEDLGRGPVISQAKLLRFRHSAQNKVPAFFRGKHLFHFAQHFWSAFDRRIHGAGRRKNSNTWRSLRTMAAASLAEIRCCTRHSTDSS